MGILKGSHTELLWGDDFKKFQEPPADSDQKRKERHIPKSLKLLTLW